MKTLHLCTSASWGGLELYACTIMMELQNAGCEVVGVCTPGTKVEEYLVNHNVPVLSLPGSSALSPRAIGNLHTHITERGSEIVHAHFHKDIWTSSLALTFDSARKLFLSVYLGVPKKKDIFHRLIYKRLNGIYTSSRELSRTLPDLYPVSPSRVHYLPYGRSLNKYTVDQRRKKEIRTSISCREGDFLVGSMVRIDPGKGVMDFVRSYESLDTNVKGRTTYVIIGEPTRKSRTRENESPFEPGAEAYFDQIKSFISRTGIADKVLFAGYQSDLIGYLSALDVFVFPSRDELYSLVVLDAMAMGLPVVAAAAGGTLDQIRDQENGLLYKPGDTGEMAAKISSYLQSEELRIRHGSRAKSFVEEHHSMETMIRQLMDFYRNLP